RSPSSQASTSSAISARHISALSRRCALRSRAADLMRRAVFDRFHRSLADPFLRRRNAEQARNLLERIVDILQKRAERFGLLLDRANSEGDQAKRAGDCAEGGGDRKEIEREDEDEQSQFDECEHDQNGLHSSLLSARVCRRNSSCSS